MIVVADTSPINYLVLIGEIDLLQKLFGKALVPNAVWNELSADGAPIAVKSWIAANPTWVDIGIPSSIDKTITLGLGEV